jgi:predicted RNase H-like nuclease (RuvC/YqgF family)
MSIWWVFVVSCIGAVMAVVYWFVELRERREEVIYSIEKIKKLQSDNEILGGERQRLSSKLEAVEAELSILKGQIHSENELARLAADARISTQRETIDNLYSQISGLEAEIVTLKAENRSLSHELRNVRERYTRDVGKPGFAVAPSVDHRANIIRRLHNDYGWSVSRIAKELWGYRAGTAFYHVKEALENATD